MCAGPGVILTTRRNAVVPIIKPIGDFCNLRCDYCFYNGLDQSTSHKMSLDLLEKLIAEYCEVFSGSLEFVWHGGEPLLAGMAFFQHAVEFQQKYARDSDTIRNMVQTNGTLVDDRWAAFFKNQKFKVGVSLDGNMASHDTFRKSRTGRGTFDRIMSGVETLRRHGIEPGFIRTVTRSNLGRARDDFFFFTDTLKSRSWGLNSYLDISSTNQAMSAQSVSNEELTALLLHCIDLWLERDEPELQIREIENFLAGVLGKRAQNCSFNGTCTNFFCVNYDGRVYPCDRSSYRSDLEYGNLTRQHLREVLNSPVRMHYINTVSAVHKDCIECEWNNACHNGCTMLRVGGIGGKYFYCETRKAVFSYMAKRVKQFKLENEKTTERSNEK